MVRIDKIDAQRGVAILAVLQFHLLSRMGVYETLGLPPAVRDVLDLGWIGVDVFFVLSAYLLTSILLRHREEPGAAWIFYQRRAVRILPLYAAFIATGLLLSALWRRFGGDPDVWLWSHQYPAWVYATFLQNVRVGLDGYWTAHFFAPTWSLAVEEHFYLVVPILVGALAPRRLVAACVVAILVTPFVRGALTAYVSAHAAFVWSIARCDSFAWGILLALAAHYRPAWLGRVRPLPVFALAGGALAAFARWPGVLGIHEHWAVAGPLGVSAVGLLGASLTAVAIAPAVRAASRWSNVLVSVFAWFGRRCYSLYLLHMPILGLTFLGFGQIEPHGDATLPALACGFAGVLTFLAADATYRWIEQPLTAFAGRQLRYRDRPMTGLETGASAAATAAA